MAKKKYKLFFTLDGGEFDKIQIINFFKSKNINARNAAIYKDNQTGAIDFQKENDKQMAFGQGSFSIENSSYTLFLGDPRSDQPQPKQKGNTGSTITKDELPPREVVPEFFNPYHFIDVSDFTPQYDYTPHDSFSGHTGKITVEAEFKTPFFIPDPDKTTYIISDDTVVQEEEDKTTRIHNILSNFKKDDKVFFNPNIREWDEGKGFGNYVVIRGEKTEKPYKDWETGTIKKKDGINYIESDKLDKASRWAHREMEFFKVNGEYLIPGSTFRGMLRSTIETLSNSCFPGYDNQDNDSGDMFYRLDVSKREDRNEALGLKPIILKQSGDNWQYVEVNEVKVLSPHLYNRIGASGNNALGAYQNSSDGHYEKISIIGKDDRRNPEGLYAYHYAKRRRGSIERVIHKNEIELDNNSVAVIKGIPTTHRKNKFKHTFPYACEPFQKKKLFGIIRKRQLNFILYKIKAISEDEQYLQKQITGFKNSDPENADYAVCEISIKTSFDIDKKTQHRAFFIYGATDFDQTLERENKRNLSTNEIKQFRSLLKQRKQNADKVQKDKQGINLKLAKEMYDDIYDGMLAFYSINKKYLTYTKVPQKPYKKSIRDLLKDQKKLACNDLHNLCPACNMFGTVNLELDKEQNVNALKGKISVSNGEPVTQPKPHGKVILKALGSPKPTYYPFYIINNRGDKNTRGEFQNYDNGNIRIGRKVYLHHNPEKLDYEDNRKTNLNSTISPLPAGTKFSFEINFTNLSNYELGILLCSLDMRYKGEKAGYHLGMGKSLGLGSCMISLKKVSLLDISAYYNAFTGKSETDISSEQTDKFISAYQYVQASENEFSDRKAEMDKLNLLNGGKPPVNRDNADYFSLKYINEFHFLKALNIHPDKTLSFPIVFAGNTEKGFEWYQKARKGNSKRLFDPGELEKNMSRDKAYSLKASLQI